MKNKAWIFTDGACSGNPGPGGWGLITVLAFDGFEVEEKGGTEAWTTNNRMELEAVIQGLSNTRLEVLESIEVFSDSSYVIRGITEWVVGWQRRCWKKSDGQAVLNIDLWVKLLKMTQALPKIYWRQVRGHHGVPGNERADRIAVAFAQNKRCSLYRGSGFNYPEDWVRHLLMTQNVDKSSVSRTS